MEAVQRDRTREPGIGGDGYKEHGGRGAEAEGRRQRGGGRGAEAGGVVVVALKGSVVPGEVTSFKNQAGEAIFRLL